MGIFYFNVSIHDISPASEDEAGHFPGNQRYARYQIPEIFLTTIYREP